MSQMEAELKSVSGYPVQLKMRSAQPKKHVTLPCRASPSNTDETNVIV